MNVPFRVGERVELASCPGPGTVTGFAGRKILVVFDDFAGEPAIRIRPESLRLVEKVSVVDV